MIASMITLLFLLIAACIVAMICAPGHKEQVLCVVLICVSLLCATALAIFGRG